MPKRLCASGAVCCLQAARQGAHPAQTPLKFMLSTRDCGPRAGLSPPRGLGPTF